jgi:hypothetical protein
MTQNLEEFKLLEKAKLSYLKNRGNILDILKDLNWPADKDHINYVQKLVGKFKKKESKDVSVLISNTLMQHIMLGYESRIVHLTEMLKALSGRDKEKLSICCEAPAKQCMETAPYGYEDYTCLDCGLTCKVKIVDKADIVGLKIDILEQLRTEDEVLVDIAEAMGYTNKKEEQPQVILKQQQNILVMGEGVDKKVIEDASKLAPMEREKIIEKIYKEFIDVKVEKSATN